MGIERHLNSELRSCRSAPCDSSSDPLSSDPKGRSDSSPGRGADCTSFTAGVRLTARRLDVVYVGMARRSIRGRLLCHVKTKGDLWTHFSVFEVWDNIRDEEIVELEGLFRHLYRKDSRANELNVQRNYRNAAKVRNNKLKEWDK